MNNVGKKNFWNRSAILRNIMLLASGTILVQVLNFLCYPIISRLYLPEAFGVFATFTAIFNILDATTCLRLEVAIPLPRHDNLAFKLLVICIIISLAYSLLAAAVLLGFQHSISGALNLKDLQTFVPYISLSLFGAGIYKALISWNIRQKSFKNVVRSQVQQVLYKNVTTIGLGWLKFGASGLIFGFFISQITGLTVLIKSNFQYFKSRIRHLSVKRLGFLLHKYRKYPMLLGPSSLINSLGLYLPVPFLSYTFNAEVAGLFAFSIAVIATPFKVFGQAIGQVYLGEGAELYRKSDPAIVPLFNKLLNNLTLIGVIPVLLFFLFGEEIFGFFFGLKWVKAGEMTKYLIITYYMQFLSTPVSQILNIVGKQKVHLFWDILRLAFILLCFLIIHIWELSSIHAVITLSVGMAIAYFVLSLLCRYFIRKIDFHH